MCTKQQFVAVDFMLQCAQHNLWRKWIIESLTHGKSLLRERLGALYCTAKMSKKSFSFQVWVCFQVSVAVLLDNFLSARFCDLNFLPRIFSILIDLENTMVVFFHNRSKAIIMTMNKFRTSVLINKKLQDWIFILEAKRNLLVPLNSQLGSLFSTAHE